MWRISIFLFLSKFKKDKVIIAIGALFLLMYFILESWHLSNYYAIHIFPSGFHLSQEYYELFRNENVAKAIVLVNSLLCFVYLKKGGDVMNIMPYWFVYGLYVACDALLYQYNANTKYESIIYFICGLLDLFFLLRNAWTNWKLTAKI